MMVASEKTPSVDLNRESKQLGAPSPSATATTPDTSDNAASSSKGLRFWLVIASLLLSTFLAALDITALSTSQPTIARSLNSNDFTWMASAYALGSTAIVPWSANISAIFGRRIVLILAILVFSAGSILCGVAHNMPLFIAGRGLQGIGAGMILVLVEIILSDLVPLKERGAYQGAFGATWALASAIGPIIGAALASANWRWIFWLNLLVAGPVLACVWAFLKVKTPAGTFLEKLKKMDIVGNLWFIVSITLFAVGLTYGGNTYPWDDAHTLAPLIIGGLGLVGWLILERYLTNTSVPWEILSNRTSLLGYLTTFLHSLVVIAIFLYWPAWLQGVQGQSPIGSSVSFFTVTFLVAPSAVFAGGSIDATGKYRAQNWIAWVLLTVGAGLISLANEDSSRSLYLGIVMPLSIGLGLLFAATTFPVLSPLPPHLAGHALSFLIFTRNLGNLIGNTVASVALTNELSKKLPQQFVDRLPAGIPSAFSAITELKDLPEPLKGQVKQAYSESFRTIWYVCIAFGGVGFAASLFIKHYDLHAEKDETYALEKSKRERQAASMPPV